DEARAGAQAAALAERSRRDRGRSDAQDGEIGVWIASDDLGATARAVGEGGAHARCPLDDVAVREHEAVGSEEEPRARAGRLTGTVGISAARTARARIGVRP